MTGCLSGHANSSNVSQLEFKAADHGFTGEAYPGYSSSDEEWRCQTGY